MALGFEAVTVARSRSMPVGIPPEKKAVFTQPELACDVVRDAAEVETTTNRHPIVQALSIFETPDDEKPIDIDFKAVERLMVFEVGINGAVLADILLKRRGPRIGEYPAELVRGVRVVHRNVEINRDLGVIESEKDTLAPEISQGVVFLSSDKRIEDFFQGRDDLVEGYRRQEELIRKREAHLARKNSFKQAVREREDLALLNEVVPMHKFDPVELSNLLEKRRKLFLAMEGIQETPRDTPNSIEAELAKEFADFLTGADFEDSQDTPISERSHNLLEDYNIYIANFGGHSLCEMVGVIKKMQKFKKELSGSLRDENSRYHSFAVALVNELAIREESEFYGISTSLSNDLLLERWEIYISYVNFIGENGSQTVAGKYLQKSRKSIDKLLRKSR